MILNLKKLKIFLFLFAICFILIGIPLIWMESRNMNGDIYYYVSIANYYLYYPNFKIRDAFTVGPVIPAILALIKFIILKFIHWSPNVDFYMIKTLSFFCYFTIILFGYKIMRTNLDKKITFLVLFLSLVFMKLDMDTMTLNGELVSVTFISVLMFLLQNPKQSKTWIFFICCLSILIIYTKLQSVPILALLLFAELFKKKPFITVLLSTGIAYICIELFLYISESQAGLLKNIDGLYEYVKHLHNTSDDKSSIVRCFSQLLNYFPFALFIMCLLLFENYKINKNIFSDWKIWIFVTLFSIMFSGAIFEHYLLLIIPFILKFSGPAISNIKRFPYNIMNKCFFAAFIIFLLYSRISSRIPNFMQLHAQGLNIFPNFKLEQIDDIGFILKTNPGKVFFHGWDYGIHTYLNTYSLPKNELAFYILGIINGQSYINNIISNKFTYLIDTNDFSHWPQFTLSRNSWGVELAPYYDLIYQQNGISVYKLKSS